MVNKKNTIAIGSSIASLIVAGVIFAIPVGIDIPGSMSDIKEVKANIETSNKAQESNYSKLTELRLEVKNKEKELESVGETYAKSQELFSELLTKQQQSGDWSYHVPSLLIELETFADSQGISIAIDYKSLNGEGTSVSASGKGLKAVESNVQLYGSYGSVKNYINMIENIDFLSVDDLQLNRVENGDLAGTFTLSVYYME